LRDEHENLKCPFSHCFAAVLATEHSEHVQQSHGAYECALGGCENGGSSHFLEVNLIRHLWRDHHLAYDAAHTIVWRTARTLDKTAITPPMEIGIIGIWHHCPTYSK
jgi:hypothetical protein